MTTEITEATDTQVTPAQPKGSPIMQMLSHAVASGQPIEVIRELMAMSKELAADEARRLFDEAVANAKAEIRPIARTRDAHNSKYADMGDVADAIDPIISKYGLSYRHKAVQGDKISVTCILSHKAGHSEETTLSSGADKSGAKNDIQAIGSTLTYLQRYTVMLALGLATTRDDDGSAAGSGELVSMEQIEQLQALVTETNSDVAKFCQVMKVESLAGIPANRFSDAVAKLNAKKSRSA